MILIVDDEVAVREISQLTLEDHGYRVITANNGAEAIECYTRLAGDIKVVLIDMMMPVLDGPATIQALSKVPLIPTCLSLLPADLLNTP